LAAGPLDKTELKENFVKYALTITQPD
jgi:hypothetical protein